MGKSVPENSQGSEAVARLSPSASVPQASKEKKEALQLFKEGVKAYRSGKKAKARSLFEEGSGCVRFCGSYFQRWTHLLGIR